MSRAARAFALVLAFVWPLAGPADASPSSKSGEGPPAAFSRAVAAGAGGRFTLEVQVERAGRREIPLHALSVELNGDRVLRLEDLSSATGGALRGVALERKNELRVALYASRPTSVTVTVHDNSTHPPTAVFGPEPFEHRPAARLGWRRIPFASARAVARSVSFPAPPMPPPNIVLIIGDDHAWTHSGFMGHELALTPALDSLAEGGTTFTNAQLSASTCRPSLQTLLSGLHPEQWNEKRAAIRPPERFRGEVIHMRTLPRELARRGYRSWEGGKMWEGTFEEAGFTHGMATTTADGIEGWGLGREGWDFALCGPTRESDAPCPALEPVQRFLDEAQEEPFFLWFAPTLPHVPFDPPILFRLPYLGMGLSSSEIRYLAQTTRLDAVVEELLRELDQRGLRENTLVIYLSDNGWEVGQGFDLVGPGMGKGSLHELGTRTPIVFHWPGNVPAGVVRDDLVSVEDLFSTIIEYGGGEPLPDRRGVSLKRSIEDGGPVGMDRYVSFYRGKADWHTGYYVRTPEWRYTLAMDGHETLYRIAVDPLEEVDLAQARRGRLREFRDAVLEWESSVGGAPERLELAGRLVSLDGKPASGVTVELAGASDPLRVQTDTNGAFRFQNLPHGDYRLEPGAGLLYVFGRTDLTLPVGSLGGVLPDVSALLAGGHPDLRGSSRIVGYVTDAEEGPMAHARVSVQRLSEEAGLGSVVLADAEGRFLVENLPPGRYWISVKPDGRPPVFTACKVATEVSDCDVVTR